jgi:hypothetical protein
VRDPHRSMASRGQMEQMEGADQMEDTHLLIRGGCPKCFLPPLDKTWVSSMFFLCSFYVPFHLRTTAVE